MTQQNLGYSSALEFVRSSQNRFTDFSWSRKVNSYVLLLPKLFAERIFRSVAIDYLQNHYRSENVAILFFYFDYKAQQSQTTIEIAMSLLKQLLCKFDHVPSEVDSLFDLCTRTGIRPDQSIIVQLLMSYSSKVSSIYAILDALDECSDDNQISVLALLSQLQQKSNYKILVSFRSHLKALQKTVPCAQTIEVRADESDLRNYIIAKLDEKKNKSMGLRERCLQLAKGVDGMYLLTIYNLLSDRFLLAKFQLDHVLTRKNRERD